MNTSTLLDSAGARIADRLHSKISELIDGNHIHRSEVINSGSHSCPCHILYRVEWIFTPYISEQRLLGNAAVSTHFGFNHSEYDEETLRRCDLARFHKPLREKFIKQILAGGGRALADSAVAKEIWDFDQHSVHTHCSPCSGGGEVRCRFCFSGYITCSGCGGRGSNTSTRYVAGHNGSGNQQSYQQACYTCGGSGTMRCHHCRGSCRIQCNECGGHGFFTKIMSVTLTANPRIRTTSRTTLHQYALSKYLATLSATEATINLDFKNVNHKETAEDKWQIDYEANTTVTELHISLRNKFYVVAAISDDAVAFVRPPIFDDVFKEEIADLRKVWSGNKKSFNNSRARGFFARYAGQPVLDVAMKSVAKLKSQDQRLVGRAVSSACDGYISNESAELLGNSILKLLNKVSPPSSLQSWVGIMTPPFLLIFLGAQNWTENNMPSENASVMTAWLQLAILSALITILISPIAAIMSTIVSSIRRRSVPAEYRQRGRNWRPLKSFIWISIAVATLGSSIGALTHHRKLPHWNNWPANTLEELLSLNQFSLYAQISAKLKTAGFFVAQSSPSIDVQDVGHLVFDVQVNLKRLGYKVTITGEMDNATRQAIVAYAKRRKVKTTDLREIWVSLCDDISSACRTAP